MISEQLVSSQDFGDYRDEYVTLVTDKGEDVSRALSGITIQSHV